MALLNDVSDRTFYLTNLFSKFSLENLKIFLFKIDYDNEYLLQKITYDD